MRIIKINENNAYYWHMKLWNWLAKNPSKKKENWPGWRYINYAIFYCFACSIGADRAKKSGKRDNIGERCGYCPIVDWKSDITATCEKIL